ncbi:MAG: biotin--[acetyl-CoA-carboxylase] ligase [Proteobacteria bacterium]|nr:biotin--[acetyl-CoA-carboxylase] ligase [Pseudomonadota bacterium]MBU1739599.1 biotin--[acetyl-CoA-carboxylase] ligase [Pseudomonadota bacterium]
MGIINILSPAVVRQITRDEIAPDRSHTFPPETVDAVCRYGAIVGSTIHRFDRLERGMDRAREMIREHEAGGKSFPSGLVILANELMGGRGRFQRSWHAPAGGLWMTVVLVNTLLPSSSSLYTLATGVSACETIREIVPEAAVKWVNDVHCGGKKLCGVLAETMRGPVSGDEYILLGIGINVNNEEFPPEISSAATSLKQLTGVESDVNRLAATFLANLSWNIGLLHYEEENILAFAGRGQAEDPELLLSALAGRDHLLVARWKELSDSVGRRVIFGHDVQKNPQFEAVVLNVDEAGRIVMELPDGTTVVQNSGEIIYLS